MHLLLALAGNPFNRSVMKPKKIMRYDEFGPIVLMASADSYFMVRRPHCEPFVMTTEQWNKLKEIKRW